MDAIVLLLIGIAISLIGIVWNNFEKKQYIRYRRKMEKERESINENIRRKTDANEGHEQTKGIIKHIGELEKGNYIRKEESEMSDQERKFFEKYDKKIDKETGKIINDIEKTQAKNNNDIKEAMWEREFIDLKHQPPKITEYIGLILTFIGVILQVLELMKK